MGFGFAGVGGYGIPMRTEGLQDGGQACTFVHGEINGEWNKAGTAHLRG